MIEYNIVDPFVKLVGWQWMADICFQSIILRILLAVICGGILGVERAKKMHAAGFRTYILVCLGSTIAMMTNEFISLSTSLGDTARLGAQVISGIGFLGAGTILVTSRNQIKGLTTAAGLWACACLGLAIGIGFYTLAVLATLVIIIIFTILPKIESIFTDKSKFFAIHIEFQCRENLKSFIEYLRKDGLKIISIEHNSAYSDTGLSVYTILLCDTIKDRKISHDECIEQFKLLEYVNYAEKIYN